MDELLIFMGELGKRLDEYYLAPETLKPVIYNDILFLLKAIDPEHSESPAMLMTLQRARAIHT